MVRASSLLEWCFDPDGPTTLSSYERPAIRRMHGYTWGEQPEDPRTIKLNTNENPYPPSPAVAEALRSLDSARLRRYPPPLADDFRAAAGRVHDLPSDWIMATNGGDELLRLLITTFLEPGQPLATTAPSYSLYPVLAAVQACPTLEVPLADDFDLPEDLAARANAAGAGLTCVVNPHAPTGRLYTAAQIDRLAGELDGLLLVDEAYVDFVDPALEHSVLPLLARHDNLVLLRTLSKGYALAGLRFGYGLAQPSLLEPMVTKTRDSYNVDLISQVLATAAISDQDWATENWQQVRQERARLTMALRSMGCEVPYSQTNFVLARMPDQADAARLKQQLQANNILVRHFATEGLSDRLRISIGSRSENDALLQQLGQLLEAG